MSIAIAAGLPVAHRDMEAPSVSKVLVYASMSLDGYVAGPDVSVDNPMGVGGERLHEWMMSDPTPADRALAEGINAETGAVVLGRRTFDIGLGLWEDVPYPVPSFVVTHETRPDLPQRSGTFSFVAGVEAAIERATTAAGERLVTVMGADVQRQVLAGGLADEVMIALVPVLLGGGAKLFDGLPAAVFIGPVSHLRFGVR